MPFSDDPVLVDATGLQCPLPILKARKALAAAAPATHVWVEVTDPGALIDFPAFCQQAGHTLVASHTKHATNGQMIHCFDIRKGH